MESASLRIADEAAADALAQSSELDKTENDLNINISDAIAEDRSSQTDEAKSPASENKYMSAGSRQGGDEQRKANSEDLDEFGNPENEEEYLKISPERLKALVKPTQGKKKDKPMFSHTCSRCGKVWEMPIQLDASRPMFCADCLPIIKEEQKNKGKIVRSAPAPESRAMPARESTSGGRGAVAGGHQSFSGKNERKSQGPNRPRIIGDLPSLSEEPSYSPLAIRHSQPEEAKSPAPENKYMSAVSRQGGDEKRKAISGGLLADL
jgi:CxxC-x17-CxxC domain-containing protein